MNKWIKKVSFPLAVAVLAFTSFLSADLDPKDWKQNFAISPVIVSATVPGGVARPVCVMFAENQKGDSVVAGVADVGPAASCPKDVMAYIGGSAEFFERRGLDTGDAEFVGNSDERVAAAGQNWRFGSPPLAIFFRTKNLKTGREVWSAFCVSPVQPEYQGDKHARAVIYARSNPNDRIDGFGSKVKCDGVSFALRNQIQPTRPTYIASPDEVQRLASRAQAATGARKRTDAGTVLTKSHAERR